jgi:hypothetical protein
MCLISSIFGRLAYCGSKVKPVGDSLFLEKKIKKDLSLGVVCPFIYHGRLLRLFSIVRHCQHTKQSQEAEQCTC